MRSKVFFASDWQTVVGTMSVDLPFTGPRRVDVDFVTAGANVFLETEGEDGECHRLLMFSGFGSGPYRDWETDRKSTRLNSSHSAKSRMPSSA